VVVVVVVVVAVMTMDFQCGKPGVLYASMGKSKRTDISNIHGFV
jgi:hypothetical protein